uniref:Uncharacterized protein n=1 Tax=Meloidogyne incognita TaxID=6306 RepID=A0A914LRQ0_MELIC
MSYTSSENTEENKIEQIFEQNKGGWISAKIITNSQKHTNGDNKEDKIRNHLHAKYVEAKRKNQRIKASAAADEVNYEFDLNVISERMAERYFNIFNKEIIDLDPCQGDSKNEGTKVDKKRTGNNESNPNKKSKIIINSADNSNQANKPNVLGKLFQVNDSHLSKGKQIDYTDNHPKTIYGGIHEMNTDDDDEFFTLLDCLDDSHNEHANVDSPSKF